METLQNNFTTIEQSKKLLSLGLPADSSDCYYQWETNNSVGYKKYIGENPSFKGNLFSFRNGYTIPCWSVGRLIEIFEKCYTDKIEEHIWYNHPGKGNTIIERVLWDFNDKTDKLDFSKLEE